MATFTSRGPVQDIQNYKTCLIVACVNLLLLVLDAYYAWITVNYTTVVCLVAIVIFRLFPLCPL